MPALRTNKDILVVTSQETVLERLKHQSVAVASGMVFAFVFSLLMLIYLLWVIAGAAFVAIPAMLGIMTMELKRVRP